MGIVVQWTIITCFDLDKHLDDAVQLHPDWNIRALELLMSMAFPLLAIFSWRRWCEANELLADADTDGLTSLYNRRKAEYVLEQEFDRALRYGRPLSLVLFDVDHFKLVNDTRGHPVGDLVLAGIARRIKRSMRATDHLARWGGEEFMLICPETDTEGATIIAERMRRAIKRRPFHAAGVVTASFGIGSYSGEGNVDILVKRADQHLYAAKQRGRDCVVSHLNVHQPGVKLVSVMTDTTGLGTAARLTSILSTIAAPMRRARQR